MTVRMFNGDKYANVHNSPDSIESAKANGYWIVEDENTFAESEPVAEEPNEEPEVINPRRGRKPRNEE